ncbi:ATP synthase subunit I [Agaribacterium haliotis]|uniref:ATP synthase subunit I n=1 Tax=Agaribacterium haliotis TaxID=2013869 RepID=UPI000BB57AE7|nr:ATP synthase subunit I [Agaribacterium haliotis]
MNNFSPLLYSLKLQLLATVIVSPLAALWGKVEFYSLLLGVAVYVLPNLYFTYYAFRFHGADYAAWIKHSFMWGEMGKLSLTAIAFALVYRFVDPLEVKALFSGFALMIILQCWLGRKVANMLAETNGE